MSVRCDHCGGRTECDCATCGKTIEVEEEEGRFGAKIKRKKQIAGICKICGGK